MDHRAAWLSLALMLAACGGGETTSGSGATGGGGSSAGGSGGSSTGGGGSAGSTSTCDPCPAGSHEVAGCGCEAELTGWTAGPLLKDARDHHVTFVEKT